MESVFDKAVGVTFGNGQEIIKGLRRGDKLSLIREPENQYDPNAVRIESRGRKLGYCKKDGIFQTLIKEGRICDDVEVWQVTGGGYGMSYGLMMKATVK